MKSPTMWPRRTARSSRAVRPAAGILLHHVDDDGEAWVLLGLRSRRVSHPGTWSTIGGGLDVGEQPLAGALREFHEECSIAAHELVGSSITAVVEGIGTPERPYTLFVVEVLEAFDHAVIDYENDDLAWWPVSDVDDLPLHPRFASAWRTLKEIL